MPVSVEDFEKYKKERGGLSSEGFEAYKESLAVSGEVKEKEPAFTKVLKGIRSVRDIGRKILEPVKAKPGEDLRYVTAMNILKGIPSFALEFVTQPHGLVKMMEEEPPPVSLKQMPVIGRALRTIEEPKLLAEEPIPSAVEFLGMPLFMKHILTGKLPPTKPALARPSIPGMAEAYEKLAKPKVEVKPEARIPGKAEMELAKELRAKGVTEKPPLKLEPKLSDVELKTEATEMLGEAKLITKPNIVKGKGRRGVSVQYDPMTTPEWYTRTGMTKTEVLKGLRDISEKGSKAESAEAGRIHWMVEEWHKVKGEVRPEPTTEVFGGDLVAGDRVKIKGEWYTAKPSPETGEVRLVDGKQIKLDVFEDIPVEEIARVAKPKPTVKAPTIQEGRVAPEGEAVISQLYKEGREARIKVGQKGEITIPLTKTPALSGIAQGIRNKIAKITEGFRKFRFYPEAPAELRNDIRTGPVQIYRDVFTKRNKLETAIWGGSDKAGIEQATRLIFARDAVARTKANAGKPNVTLEEVVQELTQIEKSITDPKIIKAADNYKKISDIYRDELVRREKLEPDQFFEDYAPHLVEDYTPEWAPTFGIPRKMRIPYRPYTKRAVGTTKAYRQNPDVLLDHLAKIEWDNLMEDWLIGQAKKYDITPKLPREQKVALFGTDKAGRVRPWARSGRIIDIEGKRYRAFSPTKPFTRQLFPTEEGTLMALGREKRTYLVPENVYNTFERFSEPGGGSLIYAINRANAYGKSLAILSHFTSFNFNNFIGDAFLGILQHPKKIQFLRNLDDGFRFLTKSPEKYSAYEAEFGKFLTDHAIVDATFIKELPYIYRSKNPLKKILAKSQEVSQFRESIQRIANAKYLFDELKAGRGDQVKQQWDWINTEGLPTEKALGKIGRDSYVDYMAQSKTYNRWIRGFVFPFGTWYFKMSQLVHKMGLKHPIKVGVGLSALPTLAAMFNNRNDEIREMERTLPEFIRDNRVHFVLGKRPDGTIRTLVLQTPQDALIGTKIFTIAINQVNQVLNGEKSIQQGAIDTAKNWGTVEGRGILYLTTPLIRFGRGLIDGRDPYDKQRLYPINVSKLSASQEWWHRFVYAQKCFMPFLTGYIAETEGRLKPKGQAVKDVVNNFIGLPAFGIRDYNERTQVVLPGGGVIDWDTFSELEKIEQKEASIMLDVKQGFIKSGLMPQEYCASEEFKKLLLNLRSLHKATLTEELQRSLSKRITNEVENDPITFKMWAGNRLDMAKTDEEKKYWGNIFKKARTIQMLQKLKYKPITVREHLPEIVKERTPPLGTAPPGGGTVGMSLLPVFQTVGSWLKKKLSKAKSPEERERGYNRITEMILPPRAREVIRKEAGPEILKFIGELPVDMPRGQWMYLVTNYVKGLPVEAQLETDTVLHYLSMYRWYPKDEVAKRRLQKSTKIKVKGLEILDYKETDPEIIEKTIQQFKRSQATHQIQEPNIHLQSWDKAWTHFYDGWIAELEKRLIEAKRKGIGRAIGVTP